MAVTIQNVRDFLNNLSVQRVPDATITLQLQVALTKVDATKSGVASSQQLDDAQLAYTAYLTMLSYASQMERSTGIVPAPMLSHLEALKVLYEQLLVIVHRGAPTYVPMNEQWDTIIQQYVDGDLVEDYY